MELPLEAIRPLGGFLIVVFVLYWVPTIVAVLRSHPQIAPILVINLLLGWTFIGWVVALAMSVSHFERRI